MLFIGFWVFVWAPWFPGAPSGCLPHLLVKYAIGLHCRFSVSVLLHQLWFGSMQGERGRGTTRILHCSSSLLQNATSLFTPFIFMPYTAMIIWGCKMLNWRFFWPTSVQQLPNMLQLWPMQMQQPRIRRTFANLVNVHAMQIYGGKTSWERFRFFQKWGTWAHMLLLVVIFTPPRPHLSFC